MITEIEDQLEVAARKLSVLTNHSIESTSNWQDIAAARKDYVFENGQLNHERYRCIASIVEDFYYAKSAWLLTIYEHYPVVQDIEGYVTDCQLYLKKRFGTSKVIHLGQTGYSEGMYWQYLFWQLEAHRRNEFTLLEFANQFIN